MKFVFISFTSRYLIAGLSSERCQSQPDVIPVCVIYVTSPHHTVVKHCYVPIIWNSSRPLHVDENTLMACGFLYDSLINNVRGIHVFPFTDKLECQELQNHSINEQRKFVIRSHFTPASNLPIGVISSDSEVIPTCTITINRTHEDYYSKEFCLLNEKKWARNLLQNAWYSSYFGVGITCHEEDETDVLELSSSVSIQYISEEGCESIQLLLVCVVTGSVVNNSLIVCSHFYISNIQASWSNEHFTQLCLQEHTIDQVNVCYFLLIFLRLPLCLLNCYNVI